MATLRVLQGTFGSNVVWVARHASAQSTVVFFPGDRIQDAGAPHRVMLLQDPKVIASILAAKFPAPQIFIVMPSRYEAACACYDHFLSRVAVSGEPLGYRTDTLRATAQLSSLLDAAGWDAALPCHLVGFSKGGVVLNQVLSELAAVSSCPLPAGASSSPAAAALMAALHEIHFVDVGLNCRGAHLSDPQVLRGLGAWCRLHPALNVFLHGTPRQWDDPRRAWVCIEKNRFSEACAAAGVPCKQHKYYEGAPLGAMRAEQLIEMHFRVLEDFAGAAASPADQ